MAGLATRNKGRRGQTEAINLLRERDWIVADLSAGVDCEDGLACDGDGNWWALEVKNTAAITQAHRKQAIDQAKKRRLPWLLMSKITGTGSWLIQRQGKRPVVWHNKGECSDD
jgi:sugar lactone lactonase YvrE